MPMDNMMDSSYAAAPVSPPDKAGSEKAPPESVDEQNAGQSEILIAKDKLPAGTGEGSTCTFRVAADAGDEFILEYVKEDEKEPQSSRDQMDETTDSELSALDSQENQ